MKTRIGLFAALFLLGILSYAGAEEQSAKGAVIGRIELVNSHHDFVVIKLNADLASVPTNGCIVLLQHGETTQEAIVRKRESELLIADLKEPDASAPHVGDTVRVPISAQGATPTAVRVSLRPAKVSGIITDGRGRPIEGVLFRVYTLEGLGDKVDSVDMGKSLTDKHGHFSLIVAHRLGRWFSISKEGYSGYSTTPGWCRDGTNLTITIRKKLTDKDVKALAKLEDAQLQEAVLDVAAAKYLSDDAVKALFYIEDHVRPALRKALTNDFVDGFARVFLSNVVDMPCKGNEAIKPVSAKTLNRAIKLASRQIAWPGEMKNFRVQDKQLNRKKDKALVWCGVHNGPKDGRWYLVRFDKIDDRWVLKSITLTFVA